MPLPASCCAWRRSPARGGIATPRRRRCGWSPPSPTAIPTGFAQWLSALDFAYADVVEVAVVGSPEDGGTRALMAPLEEGFRPNQVIAVAADPERSVVPLLRERVRRDGLATAYVCRNFACRMPVTDADALRRELTTGS